MNETEAFLHHYGDKSFRHAEELVASLRSGQAVIDSYTDPERMGVPAKQLLQIYRQREKHLLRLGTPEAMTLREDILPFCAELAQVPEDRIGVWSFSQFPDASFSVFEGLQSRRILGCFRQVQERVIKKAEPSAV